MSQNRFASSKSVLPNRTKNRSIRGWGWQRTQITNRRNVEGVRCPRLGRHVTSATCADGYVTARSGGNSKAKSRCRKTLPPCSRSSRKPPPTTSRVDLRIWRHKLKSRKRSRHPTNRDLRSNRVAAKKPRSSSFDESVRAAAAAVAEGTVPKLRPSHLPCPDREGQLVRPPKQRRVKGSRLPSRQERPLHVPVKPPRSRRARLCCP